MSERWYRDGACVVLVVPGHSAQDPVRIGLGGPKDAYEDALSDLQDTPVQSAGSDDGVAAALRWAHHSGWISSGDLEEIDPPEGDLDSSDWS